MRRALFLVLVLTAGSARAQITLGPEMPVTPYEPETPYVSQAVMASSASGSLVAFQARRMYAQLLDRDGRPLTKGGFPIATDPYAFVNGAASNGSNYVVVVINNESKVQAITIGLNGEISAPRDIDGGGKLQQARVASNGRGYLVTWISGYEEQRVLARELDAEGIPIGSAFAISDVRKPKYLGPAIGDDAVASDGRDYLVAFTQRIPAGLDEANEVVFVPVAGGVAGMPKSSMHRLQNISSALTGPNYVVAFNEHFDSHAYVAPVDASGTVGERRVIGSGEIVSAAGIPFGNVVLLRDNSVYCQAVRLAGLLPVDTRTLDVTGDLLLGTTTAGAPIALRLGNVPFESAIVLPGMVDPAYPLSWRPLVEFGTNQGFPVLAIAGELDVLAWTERWGVRATRLRHGVPLDAPALRIAPGASAVALGSGDGRTLIVWPEGGDGVQGFAGRYLAADGTLSPPFTIFVTKYIPDVFLDLWMPVWSGRYFVVTWTVYQRTPTDIRLWRACIDTDGNVVVPAAPLDLAVTANVPHVLQQPARFLQTSYGFLLLYSEEIQTNPPHLDVFSAAFGSDASPLGPRRPVSASIDAEEMGSLASDGKGHLLATIWVSPANRDPSYFQAVPLDERGRVTGPARSLPTFGSLVWTGTAFLLADGTSALLLDAEGRLLTLMQPLPIPPQTYSMSFTAATMSYLRLVTDAGIGDVYRVFVRQINLPRRRAARP